MARSAKSRVTTVKPTPLRRESNNPGRPGPINRPAPAPKPRNGNASRG
jgi:hypothetical protein